MTYNPFPSYNAYQPYQANTYQPQYAVQQSNAVTQQPVGMVWVDGEVGAKAYQLPANWPMNTPMPLWDTNDQMIYLKSINAMGMPNPIQKLRYKMEEAPGTVPAMTGQAALPAGTAPAQADMSDYVRRDELERMKDELKAAIEGKEARSNG